MHCKLYQRYMNSTCSSRITDQLNRIPQFSTVDRRLSSSLQLQPVTGRNPGNLFGLLDWFQCDCQEESPSATGQTGPYQSRWAKLAFRLSVCLSAYPPLCVSLWFSVHLSLYHLPDIKFCIFWKNRYGGQFAT